MGSKKHKKESKKKKHRSRSRSPLEGEERERKRHRKHKDRKKDRSPDVEEVPVDSHLVQDNGREGSAASGERERDRDTERDRERDRDRDSERDRERDRDRDSERDRERDSDRYAERDRERERDRDSERDRERDRDREKRARAHAERDEHSGYRYERERSDSLELSRSASPVAGGSGAGGGPQESLSVEQANRLRAKLGLKPLAMAEKPADDGKLKDDLGEFYHKPATNIAAQRKSDKIRERLEERKEKRKYEHKLQTTLLAEEDGDEDASAWVQKSREIDKQKQEAAKRAAMLDELDAEFGVTALVADEQRADAERSYTARELRGLRVAHEMDALADERETVLTLADKEVLAEDAEDVLVNVNIVDDERYKKNQLERKKARAGYQAYDDEAELEAALCFQRPVLAKYDDEIDNGQAAAKQRGFVIGDESAAHAQRFREARRQELVQGGVDKRLESLRLPAPRLATEYLDHHEIQAKFKKPKRKGKMRKKAKEEPIDVDDYEAGGAPLDTDDTDVRPDQLCAPLAVDDEEVEPDSELQTALARARRLRQAERLEPPPPPAFKMEESMETTDDGVAEEHEGGVTSGGAMVLDATAEFCRTLGDIPTYGQAGNRDHHAEIMDFEREQLEAETDAYMDGREAAAAAGAGGGAAGAGGGAGGAGGAPGEAGAGGAWSRVDVRSDKQPDLAAGSTVGLDAEPLLGAGVSGALQLALSKGYLERAGTAPAPRPLAQHHLAARHYSIEDKSAGGEDDKYGRRERGHHHHGHGPVQDFREKSHFRPNIKLEYVDDDGRPLCPKEAFRYLSHKFHGKGPGKNKQEKRIKKAVQEGLMKKMSSTDTPLGTLQMLQDKQRETRSPYIVLSGAKRENNA